MADDTPTVEAVTAMLREAQVEIAALKRTLAAVRAEAHAKLRAMECTCRITKCERCLVIDGENAS